MDVPTIGNQTSEEDEMDGDVRNIRLYPDDKDVLTSECEPVGEVTDEVRSLVDDLIKTMTVYQGVGIAAPQIGVRKRVAVVSNPRPDADPDVLINPEILDEHGDVEMTEGCLSIPGMEGSVSRAEKIRVHTLTPDGDTDVFVVEGRRAGVFQHEIDHLDGVLMFDHFSELKYRQAMKEYKKLRKAASREDFDLLEARRA